MKRKDYVLNQETKDRIVELFYHGYTHKQIAEKVKRDKTTISKVLTIHFESVPCRANEINLESF